MKHEYDYDSENETYSSDASYNEYALTLTLTENEQTVNSLSNQHPNRIYATMEVDGRRTKFQLDTGATCNVLRKLDLKTAANLKEANQILSLYDGANIKPLGKCQMTVRNPKNGKRYVTQL